jgi:hypothetical protein
MPRTIPIMAATERRVEDWTCGTAEIVEFLGSSVLVRPLSVTKWQKMGSWISLRKGENATVSTEITVVRNVDRDVVIVPEMVVGIKDVVTIVDTDSTVGGSGMVIQHG